MDIFGFGVEEDKTFWIQDQAIEEEGRHHSAAVTRGYYSGITRYTIFMALQYANNFVFTVPHLTANQNV